MQAENGRALIAQNAAARASKERPDHSQFTGRQDGTPNVEVSYSLLPLNQAHISHVASETGHRFAIDLSAVLAEGRRLGKDQTVVATLRYINARGNAVTLRDVVYDPRIKAVPACEIRLHRKHAELYTAQVFVNLSIQQSRPKLPNLELQQTNIVVSPLVFATTPETTVFSAQADEIASPQIETLTTVATQPVVEINQIELALVRATTFDPSVEVNNPKPRWESRKFNNDDGSQYFEVTHPIRINGRHPEMVLRTNKAESNVKVVISNNGSVLGERSVVIPQGNYEKMPIPLGNILKNGDYSITIYDGDERYEVSGSVEVDNAENASSMDLTLLKEGLDIVIKAKLRKILNQAKILPQLKGGIIFFPSEAYEYLESVRLVNDDATRRMEAHKISGTNYWSVPELFDAQNHILEVAVAGVTESITITQ